MTFNIEIGTGASTHLLESETRWRSEDLVARIWHRDPTVWSKEPDAEVSQSLGWLDAPTRSRRLIPTINELSESARSNGITDVVLCGMGGSSLAPEVFAATLPRAAGAPRLTVLDSTHPDAVRTVERASDPATTWFVISSKSGSTIETISLLNFFWEAATRTLPDPASHFIAITDPGTQLEALATERGFRAVILADPDVGGRFSALTAFGLTPAGLTGVDVSALLDAGREGALRCSPATTLSTNPGFAIGARMTARTRHGDQNRPLKLHMLGTHPLAPIGVWIEQLIAESTGKEGVGIIPINGGPRATGSQRDTSLLIGAQSNEEGDIVIDVHDPYDVGAVMFILSFATAVAGEILGINPFSQPDVEVAKQLAQQAVTGRLQADAAPTFVVDDADWLTDLLAALTTTVPPYLAIQAYLPRSRETENQLEILRTAITTAFNTSTTVGYGPRFLHSTGQLHKGGPPGGVFLQIIDEPGADLAVPDTSYSFGELITAQADGDRAALVARGRSVIAVNLGNQRDEGLRSLVSQIRRAIPN